MSGSLSRAMKLAENRSGWSHAHGRRHTTLAFRCGRGLEELKSSPDSTTVRRPRAERCVSFERHQYQHLHELMHEWVGSWIWRNTRRRCACRPVRRAGRRIRRKGKPAVRRGRKATGPTRSAELPNDRERACSEHTRWRSPRDCPHCQLRFGCGFAGLGRFRKRRVGCSLCSS
jgi:hypothetical protein